MGTMYTVGIDRINNTIQTKYLIILKLFMKTFIANKKWTFATGLLLVVPTAYFIFISLMKYSFASPELFDSAEPFLEKLGINQSLGWNINLLILFGPVLALLLNVLSVLTIDMRSQHDMLSVKLSIRKSWLNLLIIMISGLLLSVLFLYLLRENCNC